MQGAPGEWARTLRLPSAMSRSRLQSAQKALVMEVTKDTLPWNPGMR